MQPNDQQQSVQFSSDYLNSIATPKTVKTMKPVVLWGIIAGILILVIVVIIGVASSAGSDGSTSSLAGVGAKLDKLKSTTVKAQKNIQSGELRSLNGSLTLVLTNANRDMVAPLAAKDIKLAEPKKNTSILLVNAEFEKVATRLEDARLNAIYDRTYAREITFALKTLHSDMTVLYKSTQSKSLKTVLQTTDANLAPILDGVKDFNES